MQYDENAEKYGYEGEMTPIELECNMGKDINGVEHREPWKAYDIDKVDALIAQKDFEIDRLKEFNAFLKQRISNGDVGCSILLDDLEQKDKEIAKLKAAFEDVKATAYAESVDAGMRERRLKRALYKACANWAKVRQRAGYFSWTLWGKMKNKCLNKMEEYK